MRWFLLLVGGLLGGGIVLLRHATRNVALELPELHFAEEDVQEIADEVALSGVAPDTGAEAIVTIEPIDEMVIHVIEAHERDLPDTAVRQAFSKAARQAAKAGG